MRYMRDRCEFMVAQQPSSKHSHPTVTKIYVNIKRPMLPVELVLYVWPECWQ